MYYNIYQQYYLNLLNLEGIIFAHGKFKFKLFLSDLWYEPETLSLFLTFTEGFFAEKSEKKLKCQGVTYFFTWGIVKNRSFNM